MKRYGIKILSGLVLLLMMGPVFSGYYQELYYSGMSCSRIQKDSIAYPANEIFINIYVRDRKGRVNKSTLPSRNKLYKNVKPGYQANRPQRLLWRGKPRDLQLMVLMWENDNGGKTVDVLSQYLAAYVEGKAGNKYTPPGQEISGAEDPFAKLIARGYKNILGTDNDLIGYSRLRISKRNRLPKKLKRYKKIRYHFYTTHRRAGANCRTYFRFKRGRYYKDAPRVNTNEHRGRGRVTPPLHPVTQQRNCRAIYNRCADKIRTCKSRVLQNNRYVLNCSRHGSKQYNECVRYYTSGSRSKHYRRRDAESICRNKYRSYMRKCPRKKADNCGSYHNCDARYRQCRQAARR